jgi:Uncharacterized conserved protein
MAGNSSKAVRDLIPEILKLSGRECMISELSYSSFLPELENKLGEELKEYFESKELEELAGLLEVIYRIAELRGSSKAELETMRQRKNRKKEDLKKIFSFLIRLKKAFIRGYGLLALQNPGV